MLDKFTTPRSIITKNTQSVIRRQLDAVTLVPGGISGSAAADDVDDDANDDAFAAAAVTPPRLLWAILQIQQLDILHRNSKCDLVTDAMISSLKSL